MQTFRTTVLSLCVCLLVSGCSGEIPDQDPSSADALVSASKIDGIINNAYATLLLRDPDDEGRATYRAVLAGMSHSGTKAAGLVAWLDQAIRDSEEFAVIQIVQDAFSELLGRTPGGRGYWHDLALSLWTDGQPFDAIRDAVRAGLMDSEEYKVGQIPAMVEEVFQELLGRSAGPWGYWHDQAADQIRAGSSLEAVRAWLRDSIMQSEEYRAGHPAGASTDRGSVYLQQPNQWSCGPTSLTMAAAAWGVRAATVATVNEMIARIGANSNVGTPGNASLIAQVARDLGLSAEFNSSGSAAAVRAALEAGKTVVLNGSIGYTGHFVYIAGINDDGSFILFDPARPYLYSFSDGSLEAFSYGAVNPRGFAAIWQ